MRSRLCFLSRRRRAFFLIGGCILLLYLLHTLRTQIFTAECNVNKVQSAIQYLCREFNAGKGGGSLCTDLCGNEPRIVLLPNECFYKHQGKELVYGAVNTLSKEKIILKSLNLPPLEDGASFKATFQLENYPSSNDFESMIQTFLRDNFDIEMQSLEDIWTEAHPYDRLSSHQMEIIWALVNDNEYIFSKVFSESGVFPELIGSCGPLYAVERLSPLDFPSSFPRRLGFDDYVERVKIASKLLEILDKLERVHREPLYLCDVKKEHFGTSAVTGDIKFLDLDSVFPKSVLARSIGDGGLCERDTDCDFFDCKGKCGENRTCEVRVLNNNFNIVCEKIFRNYNFIFHGLLPDNKHASKRIRRVLNDCHSSNQSRALPQLQKAFYDVIQFSVKKHEL